MDSKQRQPSINDITPNPFRFLDDIRSGINSVFFGSDFAFLLTMLVSFFVIGIGGTIGFEVILPNIRGQLLNTTFGIGVSLLAIWMIFKLKDDNIVLLGRSFNKAFLLYLALLACIVLLFSG